MGSYNGVPPKNDMKFKVVMLTPEMAAELLKNNHPRQRSKKPGRISLLIRDIEAGRWVLTHQPIGIDVDGYMIDGQNRCEAVVVSGRPVPVVVCTGVPRSGVLGADFGLSRTVIDAAKITGQDLPHGASNFAGAARAMALGLGLTGGKPLTVQEMLEFVKVHRPALEFSFRCFPTPVRGISQAPVRAVIARAFYRRGAVARTKLFCEFLKSGLVDDRDRDSAAIRLRNWLLESLTTGVRSGSKTRPKAVVVYAKTEKALDHFLKGEPVDQLREVNKELFPLPGEDFIE